MRYGMIEGGLWQIGNPKLYQLLATYYPELSSLRVRSVSGPLIQHYLEVNRVRKAIEKSANLDICLWLSQRQLYAIPVAQRSSFCPPYKLPDAIFWRMCKEGGQKKFFVVCERYLNSTPKRYTEIFESYGRRSDVKDRNVLFLCGDVEVRRRLMAIESKMFAYAGEIQFVTLGNFYKEYEPKPQVKPEARLEPMTAV